MSDRVLVKYKQYNVRNKSIFTPDLVEQLNCLFVYVTFQLVLFDCIDQENNCNNNRYRCLTITTGEMSASKGK